MRPETAGPFPCQFNHFRVRPEDARDRAVEALEIVEKLLHEEVMSFDGRFFHLEGVSLAPKPAQKRVPIFFATSTQGTVRLSAKRGLGVMAAPPFPLAHVRETLDLYRQTAPGADSRLVLIRFYHVAETKEAAVAQAWPWLEPFIERMRATTAAVQPSWSPWMDLERMIADSLIGSAADIRAKIGEISSSVSPRSLVLKPLSQDFEGRKESLKLFAESFAAQAA
jgi:alkanesulfonate monooxygenase SsuD/methylene tetrahydromethanopterin reductase-like flavin-dependent oxidoreductase (luciferase family)